MKKMITVAFALAMLQGCASQLPQPRWTQETSATEAEYLPYLDPGNSAISGQAFLTQQGGGVVKASGRTVTLDPATATGRDWWDQAGRYWAHRYSFPNSENFSKARRTTTADADGRFKFQGIPAGTYYVRTEVTWEIGGYNPTQGGLVGMMGTVAQGETKDIVLNSYP